MRVGGWRFVLDAAYEEVQLAVEMTADAPGCRRDVLAVHDTRRRLFGVR